MVFPPFHTRIFLLFTLLSSLTLSAQTLVTRHRDVREGCLFARVILLRGSATGTLTFSLGYSGTASPGDYSVNYAASTATLAPGTDSLELQISATGDALPEPVETLTITATSGSTILTANVLIHESLSIPPLSDTALCAGIPFTLTSLVNDPSYTYSWNNASLGTGVFGIVAGTEQSANPIFLLNNTASLYYNYVVVVTDSNGCSTMDDMVILFGVTPNATFALPASTCESMQELVYYTGIQAPGLGYTWDFGPNSISAGSYTLTQVSWSVPDTYTVSLTLSSPGCQKSSSKTIIVHPVPQITNITYTGSTCTDASLQFSAAVTPPNLNLDYLWDFGGGIATSTSNLPDFTWNTPGTQTIGLQVSANNCLSPVYYQPITIHATPVAAIDPVPNQCTGSQSFDFQSSATAAGSAYTWTFGPDASVATDTSAAPGGITFASPGIKQATLITSANGCSSAPDTVDFELITSPVAAFSISGDQNGSGMVCAGNSPEVTFTGTLASPQQTYAWTLQDATPGMATTPSVTFAFNDSGTKQLTLIVANLGCADTLTQQLVSLPVFGVNAGLDLVVCEGAGIQPNATVSGGIPGIHYRWTCDDQPVSLSGISDSTVLAPTIAPTSPPNAGLVYHVYAVDSMGCAAFDTLQVFLAATPRPDAGPDQEICQHGPGVLLNGGMATNNLAVGPFGIQWVPDTGFVSNTTFSPYCQPSQTTTYTLVVTSAFGCSNNPSVFDSAATVQVLVKPNPVVNAGPDLFLCEGDTVPVLASVTGAGPQYVYNWAVFPATLITPSSGTTTGAIIPTVVVPPGLTGSATAVLLVSANGCPASDTIVLTAFAKPASPTLSFDNDSTLSASSTNGSSTSAWNWFLGGNSLTVSQDSNLHISQNGLYQVIATDANGCTSDTAAIQITNVRADASVLSALRLFPNPTNGVVTLKNGPAKRITVFGTSGNMVLMQENVSEIDLSDLPAGVYFLQIQLPQGNATVQIIKQ